MEDIDYNYVNGSPEGEQLQPQQPAHDDWGLGEQQEPEQPFDAWDVDGNWRAAVDTLKRILDLDPSRRHPPLYGWYAGNWDIPYRRNLEGW
ncbi:hypothetical protein OUZ56_010700 [Daphnia magna]|uniref:Uncharacterized protein n=1 Tax=Daphnia magna TaxID=35525 RepID=A0ABQ9YYU5_9CRUS|nr:hypothetical protein OUZ56_010700 [Daphnia magna]